MFDRITAEEMAAAYGGANSFTKRTARKILISICAECDVTMDELRGPSRTREIAWPRQLGMLKIRNETGMSYPQIGRILGDRDHTTIMYGCRKAQERIDEFNRRKEQQCL